MRTNNNTLSILKRAICISALMIGSATAAEPAGAVPAASFTPAPQSTVSIVDSGLDAQGKIELTVNKTAVVTTKEKYKRFSIGQPDIADVTPVGPTTLLVTGKKYGTTQIIVWNDQEQSQVIDIAITFDVQALRDEFKKMFPDVPITVDVVNGRISLKGRVPNLKIAEQAQAVAEAFSKDVLNMLEIGGGQQVVLQVQFVEMSRSASTDLGFRSFFSDGGSAFGNINGPGASPIGAFATGAEATIPDGAGISLFGAGNIGGMAFEAFLNALKQNNLARTLAEPNLVSLSGEDAEFLAGGEIPIPVPQSGAGGGSTITIEYKEFGVRLKYNAVVLGDGRIRLKVEPEVSDLDYNNQVSISGQSVPGITTRRAKATMEMNEGQTLAMAGLLQRKVSARRSATPLIGELPIVGSFFRNVNYTRSETELVILVTPKLASAMNPDQVPAIPGANWRYPNEAELYGFGDLGGPRTSGRKMDEKDKVAAAPRFVGPNGFDETATANDEVESTIATTDSE